ncbi:HU family DNA-binding protein, partial [Streptomyces triculaminicus]|uniref:HU family DNA-binding protein n=1 Tax=Streptomyces triculaminicus TaxID=2816232 RepID=UPI00379D284E
MNDSTPDRMNKGALVEAVAKELGVGRRQADQAVTAVLDTIARTAAGGTAVAITNFGTWLPRIRPARKARNPQTGGTVDVPARQRLRFVVSPHLRDAVATQDPAAASTAKLPKGT